MSTSHQNLVFVETETQTDYLVHNLPAYTLAIAVTPIAEYLLSRSNVPFRPIDDFYQETELLALGTDCFRSTVEMISEIHEVIKDEGFTGPPFDWLNYFDFLYYIKCLRDGILNAAYRVTRVLESLEPAKVYGFAPDQVSQNVRFLSETEAVVWSQSFTMRVLPAVAQAWGFQYELLRIPPCRSVTREPSTTELEKPPGFGHRGFKGTRMLLKKIVKAPVVASRRIRQAVASRMASRRDGFTLVGVALWADCWHTFQRWRELYAGGAVRLDDLLRGKPSRAEASESSEQLEHLWQVLTKSGILDRYFSWFGVNFTHVFETSIRQVLIGQIETAEHIYRTLKTQLTRLKKPIIFSASPQSSVEHIVAFVIARELGLPKVCQQHGGLFGVAPYPLLEYEDLMFADLYLTYGYGMRKNLQGPPPDAARPPELGRAHITATGSIYMRSLEAVPANSNPKSDVTVTYVSSLMWGDRRYFSNANTSDLAIVRLQQQVALLSMRLPNVRFIFKLYSLWYTPNPIGRFIRDHDLRNCEVVTTGTVPDVFALTDIWVFEIPSTGILEALTTRKPIVMFLDEPSVTLYPEAQRYLSADVTICRTPDGLLKAIETMCIDENLRRQHPDYGEFYIRYVKQVDDNLWQAGPEAPDPAMCAIETIRQFAEEWYADGSVRP